MGGAWDCVAMNRADKCRMGDSSGAVSTPSMTLRYDTFCADGGCTNGACIVGMVLQHSCPGWPCDEQGIELQHCIACSDEVMAEQSNTYSARHAASTAIRMGRTKCIQLKVNLRRAQVKPL